MLSVLLLLVFKFASEPSSLLCIIYMKKRELPQLDGHTLNHIFQFLAQTTFIQNWEFTNFNFKVISPAMGIMIWDNLGQSKINSQLTLFKDIIKIQLLLEILWISFKALKILLNFSFLFFYFYFLLFCFFNVFVFVLVFGVCLFICFFFFETENSLHFSGYELTCALFLDSSTINFTSFLYGK